MFVLLFECASPRKHRVCVVHTFVYLPVCFASQTMMLRNAVFPSPFWDFVHFSDFCSLWYFFVLRISLCRLRFCAVHSLPSLLLVFLCFFPFAILCFRIFCLSTGFCFSPFSLSSHYLANFISLIRSSFASQTMVLCSTFLSLLF